MHPPPLDKSRVGRGYWAQDYPLQTLRQVGVGDQLLKRPSRAHKPPPLVFLGSPRWPRKQRRLSGLVRARRLRAHSLILVQPLGLDRRLRGIGLDNKRFLTQWHTRRPRSPLG